ncbi:MAG: insulinase family protein [Clostridiales bacterium]|nr:insulinase family protein [Clostridiales bacterium]
MEIITLSNGLRIALERIEHARSAAVSFFIGSGSRYETAENAGVSHFIEHMLFKGSEARSAADIAEEMDAMGGQLNAYTTKEYTCLYAQALESHIPAVTEIMADMLAHPKLDTADLLVERGVVLEEIGMYEDSPEDFCADQLHAAIWSSSPLGGNILGSRGSVTGMTADRLRRHMQAYYTPERMTVSVCGRFDRDAVCEIVERTFGSWENTGNPVRPAPVGFHPGLALRERDFEQTQLLFCFEGLPAGDKDRYAAAVFSTIAGGASSSRLNQRIREELGLAYSVYSFTSSYLGAGIFGVGAGVSHDNQQKTLEEAMEILLALREGVDEKELARTKEQFKANMVMGMESSGARASAMGRGLLLENRYTDEDAILRQIDSLTQADMIRVARLLVDPGRMALSAAGRPLEEKVYKRLISSYLKDV